ncbi:CatB-related O-acetyltransferase [Cellulophaga tyrosinoxydans]|uniref:Transferase hexapeptide (Six repeat-containing protein) n=1 Tax=Cellulophaga tyrosinoxydans TaxID=504486 RepID=A0A1W2A3J1_9FLAO|nr:CatB-related O-acetyltransferase [Cellulophaga tyrosinoxydans]SMC54868.1 transferase hexapeptide (six repeat-containing protein) [Cellulophaga tyrosinoxydans]
MIVKKWILSNRLLTKLAIYFNRIRLKSKKQITYGKGAFIGFSVICEGRNGFGADSSIVSSYMGYGSYIAQNTKISKTKIGKYSSIGPNVSCIFGRHPASTFVSTHPAFFAPKTPVNFSYAREQLFPEYPNPIDDEGTYTIGIGNDVWIGANVSILDGVRIGDGAIVAANSLVNKDIAPYTIVGGVPAREIKKRFTDDEIQFLLALKWWEKPQEWITKNSHLFKDIKDFKNNFSNERE